MGSDLKLRWKPNRYRSFTVAAEWIANRASTHAHEESETVAGRAGASHEEHAAAFTRHGVFGYADYQFRQRYNLGVMGDWTQRASGEDGERRRVGGFAGFAPVEETSLLRLLVTYDRDVAAESGFWSAALQLIFSLGPHKPHAF